MHDDTEVSVVMVCLLDKADAKCWKSAQFACFTPKSSTTRVKVVFLVEWVHDIGANLAGLCP